MSDYKYEIQLKAEQLAEEHFGKDFSELTSEQKYKIFTEASIDWTESQYEKVDLLKDR